MLTEAGPPTPAGCNDTRGQRSHASSRDETHATKSSTTLSVPIQSEAVSRLLNGVPQIGGTDWISGLSHLSEATSRDAGLVADRRTKRLGAAIRITSETENPSDQEQAGQNQHSDCRPSGPRLIRPAWVGRGTADLMPPVAGTLGPMPQIDGTCLTCDGNGHQALDQQGITPAEVRWALYGPLRQALMRWSERQVPYIDGTTDLMPQIGGTCLTCDGNGQGLSDTHRCGSHRASYSPSFD